MESAEKNALIEKVKNMEQEEIEKVMVFIAGLEAGKNISDSKE